MSSLQIIQIPAGQLDNFSYLVFCPRTHKGIGVDPSLAPENLLASAREHGVTLEVLVNTHGHNDHVSGNNVVLRETGAKLAAHPRDLESDMPLEEGSIIEVGEGKIEVLHTPGHSPGSITLNAPGALLTGDTLFVTRCGRADLPKSDPVALYHSLQRLAAFPPETLVYPGHDYGPQPNSTIAYELEHNDYLKCPDLQSFIELRMG
jgi:glyoxylase-like metal-dependent hydrolase (beta-lactamase superfamily II)